MRRKGLAKRIERLLERRALFLQVPLQASRTDTKPAADGLHRKLAARQRLEQYASHPLHHGCTSRQIEQATPPQGMSSPGFERDQIRAKLDRYLAIQRQAPTRRPRNRAVTCMLIQFYNSGIIEL